MGDTLQNGAFRLSYAFEYAYMVDGAKESQRFPFDRIYRSAQYPTHVTIPVVARQPM